MYPRIAIGEPSHQPRVAGEVFVVCLLLATSTNARAFSAVQPSGMRPVSSKGTSQGPRYLPHA
jgi:hypothetical protein